LAEPDAQDDTCDWRWTPDAKAKNQTPVLVIECKAEGVDINIKDYYQGESYTRATGCQFFIANTGPELATFAEEINGVRRRAQIVKPPDAPRLRLQSARCNVPN
jgi:hypothetical protein